MYKFLVQPKGNDQTGRSQIHDYSFDPSQFVEYYKHNGARPRFAASIDDKASWPVLDSIQKKALRELVAKLAFGERAEGGMGTKLTRSATDPADRASLEGYVREEELHAQELFQLANLLELGLEQGQPTAGAERVKFLTNFLNVGRAVDSANLILVGEVLVLALYRQWADHTDHPVIRGTIKNIIRDEAGHLRYHGARVRAELYKGGFFNWLVLKATHLFSVNLLLFAAYTLLRPDLKTLTGLSWRDLLSSMESDYQKFFKEDLAYFRAKWPFRLFSLLP